MGTPLAAALLFLAACAPCRSDSPFNLLSSLGDMMQLVSTAVKDMQAVRLNDTQVHPLHTIEFLVQELVDTMKSALLHLPDVLHPGTYVSEMLPHLVAVGLVALMLLPMFVFPAKVVALFLAIMSTYYPNWRVIDPNFLQTM